MHSSPAPTPIHLINTPAALAHCLDVLYSYGELAVDLEFDSHSFAYGVTLALIQVATPDACYLIDPFADIDLNGVYDLFEDERIRKIVHSPGEDLRLLHSLDCLPKNVFDTEIAARLLNYEHTSLSILLQEKLGLAMSKKQQRSNWLLRPLSAEQITYAAADVTSLHALKAVLVAEAGVKGLMPFIEDEQDALSHIIYQAETKTFFLKPADTYSISPHEQYVLNEMLTYRDDLSRQLNKPAFKVMEESIARALAAGTMQPQDLPGAKGIHPDLRAARFINELAARLDEIQSAAEGKALSKSLPDRKRLSPEERAAKDIADRDRVEKFAPVQAALAARYGTFAARFILSNGQVSDLLEHKTTLGGMKQRYRRDLLLGLAREQGISLQDYQ